MRNNLTQSKIFMKPNEYYQFLEDSRYEILSIWQIGLNKVRVDYINKDEYVIENPTSNIVVSLWTTSAARLHLYNYTKMVDQHPNSTLYYTDTDLIVFKHIKGDCPVPIGNMLGEMSDELTNKNMVEFICGGNKQYSYRYYDSQSDKFGEKLKLRGITLDYNTLANINYEEFKKQVKRFRELPALKTSYKRFNIDAYSKIYTIKMLKRYSPIFKKGQINKHLRIYPFGY